MNNMGLILVHGTALHQLCACTGVVSEACLCVQAVKVRGESMAAAAKMGKPHGMLSIIGLEDKPLEDICAQVRASLGGDMVCQLANYLFPTGRVVSGHDEALAQVQVRIDSLVTAAFGKLGG